MINLAEEIQRELPASPLAFGGFAFVVFVFQVKTHFASE